MYRCHIYLFVILTNVLFFSGVMLCQTVNVTTNSDNGPGSLRQAMLDINAGSDASNTINLQIPGNAPITVSGDLPLTKKNTVINSSGRQVIDGSGQFRLFATIMADLSLNNCILRNGAAIGGAAKGQCGAGLGCGGGIYIDRGQTLTITNTTLAVNLARGGEANPGGSLFTTGGASFSDGTKNEGGDYPGGEIKGGESDGSPFLTGYGGGKGNISNEGGDGPGHNAPDSAGGYCGGGGGGGRGFGGNVGGGGGNGGGDGMENEYGEGGGGGGFGSGGYAGTKLGLVGGGGGFGGGGGYLSGGGFGAGSGGFSGIKGARFGGTRPAGGGAGLGGAIFVGDTATCVIQDHVAISGNQAVGGQGNTPGEGYAPDIFLFRKAKVVFNNQHPLNASFAIQADQEAPAGHLDSGVVKQGTGQLTLSNARNNYRGGTSLQGGTLSISDPKALGSSTAPITLDGGTLQPTKTMTLTNTIVANSTGGINTPTGTTLTTTGNISGSGAIDKSGIGTWKQTGTSPHTGNLNVHQGILQVDGILPSNITINQGATLQGRGTAGGNVTNNGTVKPSSNASGTLTVGGDYTQSASGRLELQFRSTKPSDVFTVNGTAQLDGALDLELERGIYQGGNNYLIRTGGGLNGFFNEISSNSRFTAQFDISPNDLSITFVEPQIILPIPSNQLPNNQKNIANYLFCANFPFENDNLVTLLRNLFVLSVKGYTKTLATLTPEQYGALPITEKNNLHYLLSLKQQSCIDAYQYGIVTPLFYTDHYQKNSHLPNYVQNTGGVNLTYQTRYPSKMALELSASYLNTHIEWADKKGTAICNAFYLAPSLLCKGNGVECKMTVIGSYNLSHVNRRITFPTPLHTQANPKSWSIAECVSLTYNHKYREKIFIIPSLTLLQTNVFNRKISENKPKELNLQTEAKTHSYLDTILSLGFKTQKIWPACCAIPSITFGWHNVRHLTDRNYTSRLDNYRACCSSFSTKTYSAHRDRFFIEGALNMAHVCNWGVNHSARVEFGSGDLILAVHLSLDWAF